MIGLFSLPRQGDQVFPPVHTAAKNGNYESFVVLTLIVQWSCTCPRFYARCVQYATSFFLFFFFFFFSVAVSLPLSLFPRKPRYIALRITLNIAFNIRSYFPVSLFACFDREKKKGNFAVTKLIAREYHTLYFNFVKTRSHDARSIEKLSVSTPSVFLFPFFFFSKLRSKRSIRSWTIERGRIHNFNDFSIDRILWNVFCSQDGL